MTQIESAHQDQFSVLLLADMSVIRLVVSHFISLFGIGIFHSNALYITRSNRIKWNAMERR